MINKRNKSYIFCIICLLAVGLVLFLDINPDENCLKAIFGFAKITKIKDVVNIVAILSGISGILVGAASIRISNLGAVKEYFQQGDTPEFIEARRKVYSKIDKNVKIDKNDVDAASIVSFFHFWGLMVKKKYLPLWVFESSSGQAVVRLYEGLESMIMERREDNLMYGEYFEWLYKKVKKRSVQFSSSELPGGLEIRKRENNDKKCVEDKSEVTCSSNMEG